MRLGTRWSLVLWVGSQLLAGGVAAAGAAVDDGKGSFQLASWLMQTPAPPGRAPDASSPFQAPPPEANPWSVGIRSGYTTIPNAILGAFFDKYMPVNGWFLETVVGRKVKGFTVYTGLTVTRASSDPGTWQRSAAKLPEQSSIDFAVFSAEALFDWEVRLHPRFAFHFGAGIGIGGAIGSISSQGCSFVVVNGALRCQPNDSSAIRDKLNEGWPIYPILHLVAGTKINIIEKLALTIDFDFRNAFGIGFGIFYAI